MQSKTRDTAEPGQVKLEAAAFADSDLAAVTGGRILTKHPAAVTIPDLKVTLGS